MTGMERHSDAYDCLLSLIMYLLCPIHTEYDVKYTCVATEMRVTAAYIVYTQVYKGVKRGKKVFTGLNSVPRATQQILLPWATQQILLPRATQQILPLSGDDVIYNMILTNISVTCTDQTNFIFAYSSVAPYKM